MNELRWADVTESNQPCIRCFKCKPDKYSAIWVSERVHGFFTSYFKYVDGAYLYNSGSEEWLDVNNVEEAKELAVTLWRLAS